MAAHVLMKFQEYECFLESELHRINVFAKGKPKLNYSKVPLLTPLDIKTGPLLTPLIFVSNHLISLYLFLAIKTNSLYTKTAFCWSSWLSYLWKVTVSQKCHTRPT